MFRLNVALWALSMAGALPAQVGFDHAFWNETAWREAGRYMGGVKSGSPSRGYDLNYHRLVWSYDPADSAIAGSVTSYFHATAMVQAIRFDLSTALVVDSVTRTGGALPFTHAGDSLSVTLPAMLGAGQLDSLTVHYHGYPVGDGFGSFARGEHNGVPVLWTLSEPYGAKDWWPCKQDLNDKIDSIDAYVTTPSAYRTAGNGTLVGETDDGTHRTCHWRHRYPISYYLIATAATNYQVLTDTIHLPDGVQVPMITYTYPEEAFEAGSSAGDVVAQMTLYSSLFGDYPFAAEKYGHARFGWGGGMEHQTMTFMGGWWYELSSHELAHQWFGDKVTLGTWHDLWLNEGFATYLSGLCYDYLGPIYWHGWLQGKIENITSEPGGSVFVPDTSDIGRLFSGRLTYNKGAMVLHMLRWVCGDTAFYQGVRAYLDDPALSYGSAITSDLIDHLETASGLDLTEFVDDWYYGEGFPSYTVTWAQDATGQVDVRIDQRTSHPSVAFFEMPLALRLKNGSMDSTIVVAHAFNGQTFRFHLPFQADSLLFDPDLWIISAGDLVLRVPYDAFGDDHPLVFPNPATDNASIHLGTAIQGTVDLRLFDASGRMLRAWQAIVRDQRIELPVLGLAPGAYVVEMTGGSGTVRLRFVRA